MTREILLDLAERAFTKSPWHSIRAALDGVTEKAFHAIPERHFGFPWMNGSISDIVYHVTGDKLVQLNHAFGDALMNWENVPVQKTDMATMLEELKASHQAMLKAIRATDDLDAKVTGWGGKRLIVTDFFLMLIEHDLYHAGQIRYIRNLAEDPSLR